MEDSNQQFQNQSQQFQNQSEQKQKNKKIMLSIIGIAVLVIGLVGVTYAFFNYTRTGTANVIRTGNLSFNAEQSGTVTLSDLFPIATTNGNVTAQTPGVGSLSIHITGSTSYDEGIEYIVKAVNVTNSNGTSLPISIGIGYEASEGQGKTIGTEDNSYFANRGGATSRYKVLSTDTISEGQDIVVGYIAPGQTGIDGNLVIIAYLDARNIAISDTYPDGIVFGVNTELDNDKAAACASYLSSLNATAAWCQGTGTITHESDDITFQQALDNGVITNEQKTYLAGQGMIKELYTDGTTTEWVNGRTVFTTNEWNSLQSSGVSFQVKVEANEGVWVPKPYDFGEVCFNYYVSNPSIPNEYMLIGFYGGLGPNETSEEYVREGRGPYVYDARCNVTDITLPSTINGKTVTSITGEAFLAVNMGIQFTSVVIPNTIRVIGEDAFSGNDLTSVTIPQSVTALYRHAFDDNQNLTSITFEGRTCTEIIALANDENFTSWSDYGGDGYFDPNWARNADAIIYDGSGNVCYDPNA